MFADLDGYELLAVDFGFWERRETFHLVPENDVLVDSVLFGHLACCENDSAEGAFAEEFKASPAPPFRVFTREGLEIFIVAFAMGSNLSSL